MDVLSIKFLSAAFMFFTAGLPLSRSASSAGGTLLRELRAHYLVCLSLCCSVCMIVNNINFDPRPYVPHDRVLFPGAHHILRRLSRQILPSMPCPAAGLSSFLWRRPCRRHLYIACRTRQAGAYGRPVAGTPSPRMLARIVFIGAGMMPTYMGFLLKGGRGRGVPRRGLLCHDNEHFHRRGHKHVMIAGRDRFHTLLRWGANSRASSSAPTWRAASPGDTTASRSLRPRKMAPLLPPTYRLYQEAEPPHG